MSAQNQAYVTLASSDQYVLGALVLAHSLRKTGTERQLVCMTTKNVAIEIRDLLSTVYNRVVVVDELDSNDEANLKLLGRPELRCTFTKLHCWRLTDYSKCIFLDADMLILSNIDELFEREEITACRDAGWPDYFNSGLFVFVPSISTYQALVEFAVSHGSFDGGDQGLLNRFFANWGFADIRKHLPFMFNCTALFLSSSYSYLPALVENLSQIRVLHFAGAGNKPWQFRYDQHRDDIVVPSSAPYGAFARYWWHLFVADVRQSLIDAVNRAAQSAAHVDELLRHLASLPIRHDSKLHDGARLHPHAVLVAQFKPAAPACPTSSGGSFGGAQSDSPAAASSSQQYEASSGQRSFADIERKLKQAFQ